MAQPDARFDIPLYTVPEAARHLDLAPSTVRYWVTEKRIIEAIPARERGEATLPFISLAQVEFVHKLREDLSLQAVTEGIQALKIELGRNWLQRDRLAHDGADILVRLAEDSEEWTRARDKQEGIPGILSFGLRSIAFDRAGLPERVTLSQYEGAEIIIDPRFSFGQPVVESRGVRVADIAQLFWAGEDIDVVSAEFGVEKRVVEAIVRTYGRPRAA